MGASVIMGCLSKGLALVLILTVAISYLTLMTVKPANAQTPTPSGIPTPSIPQFTVEVAQLAYSNDLSSITISITNQPLAFVYNGTSFSGFFYNVQTSTNGGYSWTELYNLNDGYLVPSDSKYTNVSIMERGNGTIDIQVEAMIGSIEEAHNSPIPGPASFYGQTSGWSNTQTATYRYIVTYRTRLSLLCRLPLPSLMFLPRQLPLGRHQTPHRLQHQLIVLLSHRTLLLIIAVTLVVIAFLLATIIFLLLFGKHSKQLKQTMKTFSHAFPIRARNRIPSPNQKSNPKQTLSRSRQRGRVPIFMETKGNDGFRDRGEGSSIYYQNSIVNMG